MWRLVRTATAAGLLAALLGWSLAGHAQDASPDVAAIIRGEIERQHIAGAAVAVLRHGKVVSMQGFGLANLETSTPVQAHTAFSIGSLSKQFIAAGILVLSQEGKLGLDAPLSRYLADAPASWQAITLRHLLTHTAGLEREGPAFDPDREIANVDIIRSAYPVPLRSAPGTRHEYSNLGYFILAEVISLRSGMPWSEFFEKRIFGPLGMSSTRLTSPTAIIANRAGAYDWREGKMSNVMPLRALRPSGAFVSTLEDMIKWDTALEGERILTAASHKQAIQPVRLANGSIAAYGFGWRIERVKGHLEIGHGGSLPGYRSYFARYIEDGLEIIALTNSGTAEPRDLVRAVASSYLN
jgi:CubicO group peptidase (beta-lactamase class C family)